MESALRCRMETGAPGPRIAAPVGWGWATTLSLLGAFTILTCDRRGGASGTPALVPFDSVFTRVSQGQVITPAQEPIAFPVDLLVRKNELILVDVQQANLKVFDRRSLRLLRVIGRPGDGPGEFRRPIGIASTHGGRFVVLDQARLIVSVRDSLGNLIRETPVPGLWAGIATVEGENRMILSGRFTGVDANEQSRRSVLHEFADDGRLVTSYREAVTPRHPWEASFKAVFLALMEQTVISGSYNANTVQAHERATGRERHFTVAPGWYRPLEWPEDQRGGIERVNAWVKKQTLMTGLFPLQASKYLARFQAYDRDGEKIQYYALADGAGTTLAVGGPTHIDVLRTVRDTAFGVLLANDGSVTLWVGVLKQ